MSPKTAAPADLLKRFTEDGMDGYRACEQLVALGPDAIEQAIKRAGRAKRDSRETSLSRAQINLSGALVKAAGGERAAELSKKHFGDDRHFHIAMFTDKKGATAFMLDLLAALPAREQAPAKKAPATKPATGFIDAALMERAIKLRQEGKTMEQIGAALNVKATAYLAKKIRATYGADALDCPATQGEPQAEPAKAARKPARRRRGAKAAPSTGEEA